MSSSDSSTGAAPRALATAMDVALSSGDSSSSSEHTSDVELTSDSEAGGVARKTSGSSGSDSADDSTDDSNKGLQMGAGSSGDDDGPGEVRAAKKKKKKKTQTPALTVPALRMPWFAGAFYVLREGESGQPTGKVSASGDGSDDDDDDGVDDRPGAAGASGNEADDAGVVAGWQIAFGLFDARTQTFSVHVVSNVKELLKTKSETPETEAILTISCASRGVVTALFSDVASTHADDPAPVSPPHRFYFGLDVVGRRYWFSTPRAAERSEWVSRVSGAVPLAPSTGSKGPDFSSRGMQALLALDDDDDNASDTSKSEDRTDGPSSISGSSSQAGTGLVSSLAVSLKHSIKPPGSPQTRQAAREAHRKRYEESKARRQANKRGESTRSPGTENTDSRTRRKARDAANPLDLSALIQTGNSSDSGSDGWSDFVADLESGSGAGTMDEDLEELLNISLSHAVSSALLELSRAPDSAEKHSLLVVVSLRWLFETPKTLKESLKVSAQRTVESSSSNDSGEDSPDAVVPSHLPQGENLFEYLPDEALAHVWGFLDPKDIGTLARVCVRFHEMSYELPIWASLYHAEGWQRPGYFVQPTRSRSFYVNQYNSFRRREADRKRQEEVQKRQALKQKRKKNAACFIQCCGLNRFWECFSLGTVIYLTIIAAPVLDGNLAVTAALLTPLWILLFCAVWIPCIYNCCASYFDTEFNDEMDPERRPWAPLFFWLAYIMPLEESSHWRTGRAVVGSFTLFFGLFVLLTAINVVVGDTLIPWTAAFGAPMFLGLCTISCIFCWLGYDNILDDEQRIDRILLCFLVLCGQVYFVFIALKLDGFIDWDWNLVFIPLWCFHGFYVVIPLCCMCTLLYEKCRGGYWLDDYTRWGDDAPPMCAFVAGTTILIHAPLIAFEIMLLEQLQSSDDPVRSWGEVLVPIYVLEGFALCGCCALGIAVGRC